MIDLPQSWG